MASKEPLDVAEYRGIVDDLIRLSGSRAQIEPRGDVRRVLVLGALELEAVETSRAAITLMDAGLHHASAPLVRKVFEFAVVAQWVHLNGQSSLEAFFDVVDGQRRLIADEIRKTNLKLPEELEDDLARSPQPLRSEAAVLRRFERVCQSFGRESGLYLLYRFLSSQCHATGDVTARWWRQDDNPSGLGFTRPADGPDRALAYILAAGLIWAGRAVDLNTKHRPRQGALRAVAKRVGIPSVLQLAATAG